VKLLVPILRPSKAGPAAVPGLSLSAGPFDARGTWIHGALVFPEAPPEGPASVLASVTLIAISEKRQAPLCARLARAPVHPRAWEKIEIAAQPHFRASFSVHSSQLFGLFDDRFYLHAAAGRLLSPAIRLEPGKPAAPPAGERLLEAYDLLLREQLPEAQAAFAQLLTDASIATELDSAHRYNAACAAARAAALLRKEKKPRADELSTLAARWLVEDLRARTEVHARRSREWAAARASEAELDEIEELLRGHVRLLLDDPDLQGLDTAKLLELGFAQP
jgi:hypothetical protein